MKVLSFYHPCDPNEHFQAWEHDIGKSLPETISKILDYEIRFQIIKNSPYEIENHGEISYCQLFSVPMCRPSKFVYGVLSDYINNERKCEEWIIKVKPNLICCLQHLPDDLVALGSYHGCSVRLMPWFVKNVPDYEEKTILAMCSGCINPSVYPQRHMIFNYLNSSKIEGVVLSGSTEFGKYPLSNEEYKEAIKKTKYYLSGGIYDRFVPPKYYEVARYGACIITFDMEYLSRVGFKHMETCIVIKNLAEIPEILKSDLYKTIGKNAQQMIRNKHTVEKRAEEIVNVFLGK